MKLYHGMRTETGAAVIVEDRGEARGLDPRHDLRTHSTAGFEWGSQGGGAAQLALALAADVLRDDRKATQISQPLARHLIRTLPAEGWLLTEEQLQASIDAIDQTRGRSR